MSNSIQLNVFADVKRAVAGIEAVNARLEKMDRKANKTGDSFGKFTTRVRDIAIAQVAVNALSKGFPDLTFGLESAARKATLLAAGITAAAGAASPLLALAGGLASAFGVAGIGVGAFAALVAPAFKGVATGVEAATKAQDAYNAALKAGDPEAAKKALADRKAALAALNPVQREAVLATLELKDAFGAASEAFSTPALKAYTDGVRTLKTLIPDLVKVATPASTALLNLFGRLMDYVKTDDYKEFVSFLASNVGPTITSIGDIVFDLGAIIKNVFVAGMPIISSALGLISDLVGQLRTATEGSGLSDFFQSMAPLISKVGTLLSGVVSTVGALITAAMPLAGPVLDALNAIVGAIGKLVRSNDFAGFVKNISSIIRSATPLFDVLATVLGKVFNVLSGQFAALMPVLVPAIAAFAKVFGDVLIGLSPLLPVIVELIGALATQLLPVIGQIIPAIRTAFIPVFKALIAVVPQLVPPITQVIAALVPLLPQITQLLVQIIPLIPSILQLVAALVQLAVSALVPLLPAITQLVTLIVSGLTGAITAIIPLITQFSTNIGQWTPIVTAAVGAVSGILSGFFTLISGSFTAFTSLLKGDWSGFWSGMSATAQGAMNIVKSIIGGVLNTILGIVRNVLASMGITFKGGWDGVLNVAKAAWNAIVAAIAAKIAQLINGIRSFANTVKSNMTQLWNSVKSTVQNAWNALVSTISSKINQARTTLSNGWNSIKATVLNTWNSIVNTVKTRVGNVISAVRELPGKIRGFFAGAGSWLMSAGRSIIDGLVAGIRSAIGRVQSVLSGVTNMIPNWKGPAKRDAQLLTKNGQLIMGSLVRGFEKGESAVRSQLQELTKSIGSSFDSVMAPALTPKISASSMAGAAGGFGTTIVHHHITIQAGVGDPVAIGKEVQSYLDSAAAAGVRRRAI